jgi:uncharacterized protein (UPF0212 family)
MHKVKCDCCRDEVRVALYFSNKQIITHEESALNNERYYEAVTSGEAICPNCGCNIKKIFKTTISDHNIVKLAMGELLYE